MKDAKSEPRIVRRLVRRPQRGKLDIALPSGFILGTSTAATQIETVSESNWKGVKMVDGRLYGDDFLHRDCLRASYNPGAL